MARTHHHRGNTPDCNKFPSRLRRLFMEKPKRRETHMMEREIQVQPDEEKIEEAFWPLSKKPFIP
jgi:hypothetical protein